MHGVNFSILHILIDLSSNPIQLVTHGEEVYIQIGNHNMCHLNIDISNELQTEEESGSTNDEGDRSCTNDFTDAHSFVVRDIYCFFWRKECC